MGLMSDVKQSFARRLSSRSPSMNATATNETVLFPITADARAPLVLSNDEYPQKRPPETAVEQQQQQQGGGDASSLKNDEEPAKPSYELRMPLNALLPIKYPNGAAPTCTAIKRSRYYFLANEYDGVPTMERLCTPCFALCAQDYPRAGSAGDFVDGDDYTRMERFRFRRWWKRRQKAMHKQARRDEYDPRLRHKRMFYVNDCFFKGMHLERRSMWLNARQTQLLYIYFSLLDYDDDGMWDDVTFAEFMKTTTNVSSRRVTQLFELLDKGAKGMINFEEWYFVICCLLASHDGSEKEFMLKHARMVFELLDEDLSGTISAREFTTMGWLFNLRHRETTKLFREFDLSGDQELDFDEFQFFAQAALDLA